MFNNSAVADAAPLGAGAEADDGTDQQKDRQNDGDGTDDVAKLGEEILELVLAGWQHLLLHHARRPPTGLALGVAAVDDLRNNQVKLLALIILTDPVHDLLFEAPDARGEGNKDEHEDKEDNTEGALRAALAPARRVDCEEQEKAREHADHYGHDEDGLGDLVKLLCLLDDDDDDHEGEENTAGDDREEGQEETPDALAASFAATHFEE